MSFFGLSIAKSGLFAAQKALNTIGHNIANANTPGYTRQRVEQVATSPLSSPGGRGMIGTGVDANRVTQIRNEFLDIKLRTENTVYGQWEYRYSSLSEVEAVMNEVGDGKIGAVMDDFFSSLSELKKDPSLPTARAVVKERAIAMSTTISQMHSQLEKMLKDTDSSMEATVQQINTYAKDIAKLNEQIYSAEMDGSSANDLRDNRNLLLDELSKLVNVEINEVSQGSEAAGKKMQILVNGQPLVSHNRVDLITFQDPKPQHKYGEDLGLKYDVRVLKFESGTIINTNALKGTLKAQLDMRDNMGDADGPKGIPYYMKKLDEFVSTFTEEVNRIHMQGFGLDADSTGKLFFTVKSIKADGEVTANPHNPGDFSPPNDGATDIAGFVSTFTAPQTEADAVAMWESKYKGYTIVKDGGGNWSEVCDIKKFVDSNTSEEEAIKDWEAQYKGYTIMKDGKGNWYEVKNITAKDMKISEDIEKDLDNIGAAKTYDQEYKAKVGDNTNILDIIQLRHKDNMFEWGSPEDFVKSLTTNLGADTQEAENMAINQITLVQQIDNTRQSISGVSLDEEMGNMIKYQHAYNASARMITAMDEMIDVIVNRMGRVGL